MPVLIAGATGATGRLLVNELLKRGLEVKVIVRSAARLPADTAKNANLTVIEAPLWDLGEGELADHVRNCNAVASCLGHTLSFKGLFGPPRRLVTDSVRRLCNAAQANRPGAPVKFVLMNTAGNRNRDLKEPVPFTQKLVLATLRALLPPHADNEQAADYLRTAIGQDHPAVEWCAVRPDTLVNEPVGTPYDVHPSPIRSAIFNAGKTSRINVAHFMAGLITDPVLWDEWKGRMPVIYNRI